MTSGSAKGQTKCAKPRNMVLEADAVDNPDVYDQDVAAVDTDDEVSDGGADIVAEEVGKRLAPLVLSKKKGVIK